LGLAIFELFVEGAAPAQYAIKDFEGNTPGSKARNFGRWRRAPARHERGTHL
jgi:hypothetical protein